MSSPAHRHPSFIPSGIAHPVARAPTSHVPPRSDTCSAWPSFQMSDKVHIRESGIQLTCRLERELQPNYIRSDSFLHGVARRCASKLLVGPLRLG
jgi:hypothetical protein